MASLVSITTLYGVVIRVWKVNLEYLMCANLDFLCTLCCWRNHPAQKSSSRLKCHELIESKKFLALSISCRACQVRSAKFENQLFFPIAFLKICFQLLFFWNFKIFRQKTSDTLECTRYSGFCFNRIILDNDLVYEHWKVFTQKQFESKLNGFQPINFD